VRVALLFIDGVGIGPRSPDTNPLARGEYLLSRFDDGSGAPLPPGVRAFAADTTFGVPGRPQSATNQTAIFTGQDAPALVGRHVLGYPTPALRALLDEHSVVKRLAARGLGATFANAYPAGYLDALGVPRRPSGGPDVTLPERWRRRARASASTCAFAAAGVALRTFDDARAGEGLTHDIDGNAGVARGFDLPRRSPEEAAAVFWGLAGDFTAFEHFQADEAGHAQDAAAAERALSTFDRFAREVVRTRPDDAVVLICSDHGNVEDLSTRRHTRHPVPVLAAGPTGALAFHSVADVGRAILSLFAA